LLTREKKKGEKKGKSPERKIVFLFEKLKQDITTWGGVKSGEKEKARA